MAESTLSLTRTQLRSLVGYYLGYGSNSANWTSDQTTNIDDAVNTGLRRFYFPIFPDGEFHEWSFLKLAGTVTTTAADYDYTLADSFGGIEGWLNFGVNDNSKGPVQIIPEIELLHMREAYGDSSGRPRYCALRAQTHAGTTGQRWELIFYPTPDGVYNLTYRGTLNPDALSASIVYHYGGMQHAETVKECCLWAAEEYINDNADGPHKRAANERLIASKMRDKAAFTAEFFGTNDDRSDGDEIWRWHANRVTRNGVEYGD